jgi:hypothetical protein
VADTQWQINCGRSTAVDTQRHIHSGGYTVADTLQWILVSDTQQQIAVSDKQQQIYSDRYSSIFTTQPTQWRILHGRYIYSDRYTAGYTVPGWDTYSQRWV